jgi:hypothetical protein
MTILDESTFNVTLNDKTFLNWIAEHNVATEEIKTLYATWLRLTQMYQELEFRILSTDYVPIPL